MNIQVSLARVALSLATAAGLVLAHGVAQAGPDVGVSVSIDDPGFYGRIDIGNRPPPPVIYAEPVIIEHRPVAVMQRPIYLHVPPGHYRHWAKHCYRYRACGQPVYFVQMPPRHRDHGHFHRVERAHGWDRDRHWDRGHHDHHGHGKGHGRGHDRGHGHGHGHGHRHD